MDRFKAASYAPFVMYAWDMCHNNLQAIPPPIDPRIAEKGYAVIGYLSAADCIFQDGGGKQTTLSSGNGRVCYGYVAVNGAEAIVVVRGTDDLAEWADDLDCLMMAPNNHSVIPGYVDQGFYGIYQSMWYHDAKNVQEPIPVIEGLKNSLNVKSVMVLGHSLGAAMSTYLTLDLTLANFPASACLFASPRTGNVDFVEFFEQKVANYDLFNYEKDAVPKVPEFDLLHLSSYKDLEQAKTITASSSDAVINNTLPCNHHLICYIALLDPDTYRSEMSDPNVAQDDRTCAKCVTSP